MKKSKYIILATLLLCAHGMYGAEVVQDKVQKKEPSTISFIVAFSQTMRLLADKSTINQSGKNSLGFLVPALFGVCQVIDSTYNLDNINKFTRCTYAFSSLIYSIAAITACEVSNLRNHLCAAIKSMVQS